MRTISWIFAILLSAPAASFAQDAGQPRWEVNASAGLFQGRPTDDTRGWDDWYSDGRYAASIGRYWTTHLKTEIEFAITGEGRRYTQQFVNVPGLQVPYPVGVEVYHRLQQASTRAVWQFNDNAWVHPYLNVGVVYEIARTRQWSPEQFYYPPGDPRIVPRVPLGNQFNGDPTTDRRVGFTVGGGSKFYFSPNAYINTGLQFSRAKPSTTVTLLAGLGLDF